MKHRSRFLIHNDMGRPSILKIEPEGAFFRLGDGQDVSVTDIYDVAPVTLQITCDDALDPILSIWPGDGEVKVEKGGLDVLDLLQAH